MKNFILVVIGLLILSFIYKTFDDESGVFVSVILSFVILFAVILIGFGVFSTKQKE